LLNDKPEHFTSGADDGESGRVHPARVFRNKLSFGGNLGKLPGFFLLGNPGVKITDPDIATS